MFTINDSTTVDDVIEHLIKRLNTDFLGAYLEVNHFCHNTETSEDHEFDKQMEMLVKDKMLKYDVAKLTEPNSYRILLRPNGVIAYKKGGWKKYLIELENEHLNKLKENNRPNISVGGNAIIGDNNTNNHLESGNLESSHNSTKREPNIAAQQPKNEAKNTSEAHKQTIWNKIYKWTDHKTISVIIITIFIFFADKIWKWLNTFW
jgi:hypothetical protein